MESSESRHWRMVCAGVAALGLLTACEDIFQPQRQPDDAPIVLSQNVLPPLPTSLPDGRQTIVGQRAIQLRGQAEQLQQRVAQRGEQIQRARAGAVENAQVYYSQVAGINARLQVGTTPGNPILRAQWNSANAALDRMAQQVGQLSSAITVVQTDAGTAAFLLESVRASYALQGAVDDDHRALAVIEDDVNRTVVAIDRMQAELQEDVRRQTAYVAQERQNLNALSIAITNGSLLGPALGQRPIQMVGAQQGQGVPAGTRPLAVIRFDRANPQYEQALYAAVSAALQRRPGATFELVGVAPQRGGQADTALALQNARRQAETVARSLGTLGLSGDRLRLSQTTSPTVQANEVHVYVY